MCMKSDVDPYSDLLSELTSAIVIKTGTREQIAMQYASAVMECLQSRKAANGSVYVGAAPRRYDVLQIAAAFQRGATESEVRRMFGISRSKLYGLFPGGLPKPQHQP